MDRGSYIAGNGMIAQQQRLDTLANNLANVNSRGFKADRLTFGDMMRRNLADRAGYGNLIGTLTSGPEAKGTEITNLGEGGSELTNNPLDVRISGRETAMLAVSHGGKTLYTRDGALTLDSRGSLITKGGDPVLDDAGRPIGGLTNRVEIRPDGSVIQDNRTVARLGLKVGAFRKSEEGGLLFDGARLHQATAADGVQVASGQIETSNVDPVHTMIDMIALQRAYEINQKMVQSQDESTAKLAEAMG